MFLRSFLIGIRKPAVSKDLPDLSQTVPTNVSNSQDDQGSHEDPIISRKLNFLLLASLISYINKLVKKEKDKRCSDLVNM